MASLIRVQQLMLFLIFLLLTLYSVNCQLGNDYNVDNIEFSEINKGKLNNEIDDISSRVNNVLREFQPENIIRVFTNNNVTKIIQREAENDTKCDAQVALLAAGLQKYESWALQMIDASSKIPSGLLKGNFKDLGAYDECIAVEVERGNDSIHGRHCMYSLSMKESNSTIAWFTPRLSICLPAACSPQHVSVIMQKAIDKLSEYLGFVEIKDVQCSSVDPAPFEAGEIVTIVIFSLFLGFLVGCTTLDIFIRITSIRSMSKFNDFCQFSFYMNLLRIFDTTVPRGNIPAIQGIRFFSLCWVILGHQYVMAVSGAAINPSDAILWAMSWKAVYIAIAPFAVDTFFLLSGFLLSYLFMKEMSEGRKFNPIMFYIHRYIRLTPALAALILLATYIVPRSGSGALWESTIDPQKKGCEENWWPILLYIQNFHSIGTDVCLGHTWYLAVDMQLYWISPLILYPLSKRPKIGLSILAAFIFASIITPAVMVGVNEYSPVVITREFNLVKITDMMQHFYIRPYTRAGPWLMGIFLGYTITKKIDATSLIGMTIGWIVALLSFAFIFFTYRIFQSVNYEWHAPWEVFYAGLSRHIWAFGVSWLIYASIHHKGGVVTKILSHPVFLPFGRISYCVYLVHMVIQAMRIGASRVPTYFDDLEIIQSFFGLLMFSCVAGLALSLVFESPFLVIEKMIFRRNKMKYIARKILRDSEGTIGVDNDAYINDDSKNCDEREGRVDIPN